MRLFLGLLLFILWTLTMSTILLYEKLQGKHDLENYLEANWR